MSSKEQIEANRRNGKRSKGPATAEGKAASAKNALKHGLLSQGGLLPEEDSQAYAEMAERVYHEFSPVGELERVLVETIITLVWRGRRAARIEAGILGYLYYGIQAQRQVEEMGRHVETNWDQEVKHGDARNKITDQAAYVAARSKRNLALAEQGLDDPTLGLAFIQDSQASNSLSKLSRYETAIDRRLYKAMYELQRLQAARKRQDVGPRQVIDMDITAVPDQADAEFKTAISNASGSTLVPESGVTGGDVEDVEYR